MQVLDPEAAGALLRGRLYGGHRGPKRAQPLLWTSKSIFNVAEYYFYEALSRAACCDSVSVSQRQQHLEALAAGLRQLEAWAENCPENFENRAALVGAEIARIEGRALDAMRLYEQAIQSARANGFVHNEALADELAGRFYLGRRLETNGFAHLRQARACYALLGGRWQGEATQSPVSAIGRKTRPFCGGEYGAVRRAIGCGNGGQGFTGDVG